MKNNQSATNNLLGNKSFKNVHLRKLTAIMEVKWKTLFSKNFIIMPIFSLGFTYLMKVIYDTISEGAVDMSAYALSLGVLMNICMTGIYCVAASLAEEKEKNTLRTLMTSSVSGMEFFLGSLIPVIAMTTIINVLCVFLSGFSMDAAGWVSYVLITLVSSATGAVIGMIFGIFARNQMSAGTITTPALLIFMMVPMFSYLNETLEKISGFFFTGIVSEAIANIGSGTAVIDMKGVLILAAEFLVSVVIFLLLYRRNGFESESRVMAWK